MDMCRKLARSLTFNIPTQRQIEIPSKKPSVCLPNIVNASRFLCNNLYFVCFLFTVDIHTQPLTQYIVDKCVQNSESSDFIISDIILLLLSVISLSVGLHRI